MHKDNYFSFSTLTYSSSRYYLNFHSPYFTYLRKGTKVNYRDLELSRSLVLISCEKPVKSPLYLDAFTCNYNDNSSSISNSKRYRYVKVGRSNASEMEESCQVEKMFRTSWPRNNDDPNISCTDVHNELVYGFELSWHHDIGVDLANHVPCTQLRSTFGVLDLILDKLRDSQLTSSTLTWFKKGRSYNPSHVFFDSEDAEKSDCKSSRRLSNLVSGSKENQDFTPLCR